MDKFGFSTSERNLAPNGLDDYSECASLSIDDWYHETSSTETMVPVGSLGRDGRSGSLSSSPSSLRMNRSELSLSRLEESGPLSPHTHSASMSSIHIGDASIGMPLISGTGSFTQPTASNLSGVGTAAFKPSWFSYDSHKDGTLDIGFCSTNK